MILIPQGKVSSLRAMRPSLRGRSSSLRAGGLSEPEAGAEPGPAAKGWKQPFYGGMQLIQPHLYATTGFIQHNGLNFFIKLKLRQPLPSWKISAQIYFDTPVCKWKYHYQARTRNLEKASKSSNDKPLILSQNLERYGNGYCQEDDYLIKG